MTENVDGAWSLEETLARTSDPRLWDRYQAEKRQETATSPDLRRSLIAELLAKIGTQLFAAVPKPTSSEGGWIILNRATLEETIASEKIDEFRLFVPLKAPNAVEHLRDRGLAEVFQQYVLGDPEVVMLRKQNSTPDLFKEGRAPGLYVSHHWRLDAPAPDLARLIECRLLILGEPERAPTREVSMLAEALVDRIGALRSILVSGRIQAFGLSTRLIESFVPARQWARQSLSIEVANGDLCEEDDCGKFLPMWTGIELRPPAADVDPPAQPARPGANTRKKRSSKSREVERIIREHQIDASDLGPKAAAAKVLRHMRNPPETVSALKALEKMVARVSKDVHESR
jgi:hypothetical protein